MKGELLYVYHPYRWRAIWVCLYIILFAGLITFLWYLGSQIQIHAIPVGEVSLSMPYNRYVQGDDITFTLKNNFNSSIYVLNNCPSEPLGVYRQQGSNWVRIHDTTSVNNCPSESRQVSVPPGGSVNGSFKAWSNLFNQPGKYRIVAFVEYYNALPYQDFEVIAPVAPIPVSNQASPVNAPTQNPQVPTPRRQPSQEQPTPSAQPSARQSRTISTAGGSITVQYDATSVYVIAINPAPGYTYEGGQSGSSSTQVTFKNGQNEIQISLEVQNGQLIQKIEQG